MIKKVLFDIKKIAKKIIKKIYIKYIEICPVGSLQSNKKIKTVVSLTSFPARLDKVHIVIKSIFLQSVKPDKIVLYLGNDSSKDNITNRLKKLEKKGLEIRFVDENIMSHKKYYYAFKEFPDSAIITLDDDLVYERRMIELLLESYERHPHDISAKRVHRMISDKDNKICQYNDWEYECKSVSEPSYALFATTGAGTLFPPKWYNSEVFNKEVFMEYCKSADDVWLKFIQIMSEVKVVFVRGRRVMPIMLEEGQEVGLFKINVDNNVNDICIENLENYYKMNLADYIN